MIDQLASLSAMASAVKISTVPHVVEVIQTTAQGVQISTSTHVINATDIFQQVCSFYDTAWNNLIVFSGISFAIIGVIIPIVISYIQKESIESTEAKIKSQINEQKEENNERLKEQKEFVTEQLKNQKMEFEKQIEKQQKTFEIFNEQYKNLKENILKQDQNFKKHEDSITRLEANIENKVKDINISLKRANAWFWHSESLSHQVDRMEYAIESAYSAIIAYNSINDTDGIARVSSIIKSIIERNKPFNLDALENIKKIVEILDKISTDDKTLQDKISFIKKFYETKKDAEF